VTQECTAQVAGFSRLALVRAVRIVDSARNALLQATAMKSLNDAGSGINPMANSGSKRPNVITMIAIVTLGLMLRPSAVLAKAHRKSEHSLPLHPSALRRNVKHVSTASVPDISRLQY
jgi:hypothetical protein